MSKDWSGLIFRKLRKYRLKCLTGFSTFLVRIDTALRGVKVGKKASFCGRTKFVRHPNSLLEVGDNCLFRSDKSSNLAGVRRPCLLSTLRDNAVLKIGNGCGISGAVLGAATSIILEDNVLLGVNSFVTDFDWHHVAPELRKVKVEHGKPVVIEENVWVGANAMILKGVRIGKNSIIGANSVVVSDIPPNVIAAGNPCKVVKNL